MRNLLWYENKVGSRGISIDISDGVNPCWQINSENPEESKITIWFGAMSSIVIRRPCWDRSYLHM